MVTVSAMATTLFLGGGMFPWPLSFLNGNGWLQFVAFLVKTCIFLFLFIWLRGTLPASATTSSCAWAGRPWCR